MSICDWILAGLLLLATYNGWRLGTINVLARIGSWILAYYLARRFASAVAAYITAAIPSLENGGGNEQLSAFLSLFIKTDGLTNRLIEMLAFIVIFVAVCWLIKRIAYAMTGIFGRGLLGTLNRALGAFVSFALAVALIVFLSEIVFPALIGMGFGSQPLDFMESSVVILPAIRVLLSSTIGI